MNQDAVEARRELLDAARRHCPRATALLVTVEADGNAPGLYTSGGWDLLGPGGAMLASSDPDDDSGPFDQELHTYIDVSGLRGDFTLYLD